MLGFIDVVLLQETRATDKWRTTLQRKYAAGWGLRADEHLDQWSFWGPTPHAAAGVAILVRPGGRALHPRPIWEQHWSQWFMAIQFDVENVTYTVVNVYGPGGYHEREQLFQAIAKNKRPSGPLLVGGDFNCTLDDAADRSNSTRHSHDSAALHELLRSWDLRDVLEEEKNEIHTESERRDFHARRHTYRYQLVDGDLASSRLDRFYVDQQHEQHVRQVEVVAPVSRSDHDGVLALVANAKHPPTRRRHKKRPRLKYPLPAGTQQAVADISERMLQEADEHCNEAPALTAHRWVQWKTELRRGCLRSINAIAKRKAKAYRRRRYRLTRALRAILPATATGINSVEGTVAGITRGMEGLTIDGYTRAQAIRAELVRLTRIRSRRRRRERFAVYAHDTPGAERAFFKRFHTRQGQRSAAAMPPDPTGPDNPAERLANDWKAITQRGNQDSSNVQSFLNRLPATDNLPDLRALDDEFTEDEVRDAIKACPRNKAPGPDGIPNDWYKDHIDTLVPLLTRLYNGWHQTGILPTSFRKALIACIPKTSRPRSGLDFRPIALLDSDYKIYSKMLVNRLRPHLPTLVADTQFGFVPGRQVHDALDVFHALQRLVQEGAAPSTSIAVSLDFAKAYDTLDRPFLLAVLERIGCPKGFRQAVRQMHLATTAAYMAEADISSDQQVLNGIRQGCPLAPTLFVLAVDTLYQAASAHPDIQGIPLPSGREIVPAGFADDTNMYVRDASSLGPLFHLLQQFEDASGLKINRSKCTAVALHATVRPPDDIELPLAAPNDTNRLLGGYVASEPISGKVWDLTMQQMRTRLRLAELKTTNVLQRIKLIKATLVPKFTFVARHHWPTRDQIDRVQLLIRNFVWHGSLGDNATNKRAWMSAAVASLPSQDGGLGLPVLTYVLQELSVRVVARWADPNQGLRSEIGQVRLRHHKAPDGLTRASRRLPARATLQASMVGTGLQLHHALETQPRAQDEIQLASAALQHAGQGTTDTHNWENGWLCVNYGPRKNELSPLQALQVDRYGALHVAALMAAPAVGEDILLGPDGLPLQSKDYAGLLPKNGTIDELLNIQWRADGRLAFRCKTRPHPLPDIQARAFSKFCDVVVFNYPSLLRDPGPPEDLTPTSQCSDIWQLDRRAGYCELWWSPVPGVRVLAGKVTSTAQASKRARWLNGDQLFSFHAHVWLDDIASVWRAPTATRVKDVRDHLYLPLRTRSLNEIDERCGRWHEWNRHIAEALDDVSWDEILHIPGAPATQRLLLYRIKGARITGWSPAHQTVICPHCPDLAARGGRADHIFWECPQAQRMWRELQCRWANLWTAATRPTASSFLHGVFSLRLETMPSKIWDHAEIARLPTPTPKETSATQQAIQAAWRLQVLATFHAIWRWRTDADTPEALWSRHQAQAYHDGCLRATLVDLRWKRTADSEASCHTAAAIEVVRNCDPERDVEPTKEKGPDAHQYILFFDGGSRGNPGPGGSGAVIVKTDQRATSASIIWSAAMSAASPDTTNNQAEYVGVLEGLRAAHEHSWIPLDVVGDSQLILRQLSKYHAPRNERLSHLYAQARRLGDLLGVRRWIHHLRGFNKMADAAANAAMDTQTSSQVHHPTTRVHHAELERHLGSDFAHWQAQHFARLVVQ